MPLSELEALFPREILADADRFLCLLEKGELHRIATPREMYLMLVSLLDSYHEKDEQIVLEGFGCILASYKAVWDALATEPTAND